MTIRRLCDQRPEMAALAALRLTTPAIIHYCPIWLSIRVRFE